MSETQTETKPIIDTTGDILASSISQDTANISLNQTQQSHSLSASSVSHLSPTQKANAPEKTAEKDLAKHIIAPQQQRRIIAEDTEWNLAPVDKLSDMCVRVLVANFEKSPILRGVPAKYREVVINAISTEIPLHIAAPLIPDEEYWKRRSKIRFKLASLKDHGGSWKRLYFELHLRDEIEGFSPTTDYVVMEPKLKKLHQELQLGSPFVEKLNLRQLKPIEIVPQPGDDENAMMDIKSNKTKSSPRDHLDIGVVLSYLKNLKEFGVYYGMKDCGIDFSWAFFGMTMSDAVSLTNTLKAFTLEKLTIKASGVNDDKCRLICHSLLGNSTIKYIDLGNNNIGDSGARGISKLLSNPNCKLSTLKLSNNKISIDGVKCIGKALQVNQSLENLDLRLNHLHDIGGQSFIVCIFKNKSLVSLDLSGNGLEMKSVMALAALLKLNIPSLTKLDLSCNKLGDYTGEKAVTSSTANLIGMPKVTDTAGKTIFEAISQNKYITSFDLRTTGISPEYLVAIQGIVGENGS